MTSSIVDERSGSDKVAEIAHEHRGLVTLARAGWVAKGLVYALVGVLAVPIARRGFDADSAGSGDEEASQLGAVAKIAESSAGAAALWAVAIGLALYVLWRLVSVVLPADNTAEAWATRAGYLVSAGIYAALAWSAVSFARGASSSGSGDSEDAKVERVTRDLMEMTGGRWLVGLIGVLVIAIGLYFVRKGVTASFRDELEPGGVGPVSQQMIVTLGRVGWVARGLMMVIIGWFLARAALDYDPDKAQGIDGALREATSSTFGAILVAVVALGLILYGAFCVISAPRQRLTGAD